MLYKNPREDCPTVFDLMLSLRSLKGEIIEHDGQNYLIEEETDGDNPELVTNNGTRISLSSCLTDKVVS